MSPRFKGYLVIASILTGTAAVAQQNPGIGIDMLVSDDAVYGVSFEELNAEGFAVTDQGNLHLSNAGQAVPFWIENDADGRFGPGDTLVFVGQHLAGENSHFNHHSTENVYRLETGKKGVLGKRGGSLPADPQHQPPRIHQHLEQDNIRVRFNNRRIDPSTELWYWQRLNVLDREPIVVNIDLLAPTKPELAPPLSLTIDLRGWSFSPPHKGIVDHALIVSWNGKQIGEGSWDAQERHQIQLNVPASE
ncbi:MAG: hypothetical protein ACPGZU_21230, partial [Ketobacter sp.]